MWKEILTEYVCLVSFKSIIWDTVCLVSPSIYGTSGGTECCGRPEGCGGPDGCRVRHDWGIGAR